MIFFCKQFMVKKYKFPNMWKIEALAYLLMGLQICLFWKWCKSTLCWNCELTQSSRCAFGMKLQHSEDHKAVASLCLKHVQNLTAQKHIQLIMTYSLAERETYCWPSCVSKLLTPATKILVSTKSIHHQDIHFNQTIAIFLIW